MDWFQLAGGGILLYFGAEWLVGGASAMALALRVPQLIVGLTVVAYGTSTPELIVSVQAAIDGLGPVALGNVIGSNIVNIGLILGLAAVIHPPVVDPALPKRELPVLLGSTLLLIAMFADGVAQPWEGAVLIGMAVIYTGSMIRTARRAGAKPQADSRVSDAPPGVSVEEAIAGTEATLEAAETLGAPVARSVGRSAVIALVGLAVLIVGGKLFVDSAVIIARGIGMSERIVGLTIVAIGTSLPELVTSLVAARRGAADIAVGNVVGSNIFNVLLCLGVTVTASPITSSLNAMAFDLAVLGIMTALLARAIRSPRRISRREGAIIVLTWIALTTVTIARG